MKRRRTWILFGALAAFLCGYVAWCGRAYYLTIPMPDLSSVPENARELVRQRIDSSGMRKPEIFYFESLWQRLANPYGSFPMRICITVHFETNIECSRYGRPDSDFTYIAYEDGWVDFEDTRREDFDWSKVDSRNPLGYN